MPLFFLHAFYFNMYDSVTTEPHPCYIPLLFFTVIKQGGIMTKTEKLLAAIAIVVFVGTIGACLVDTLYVLSEHGVEGLFIPR